MKMDSREFISPYKQGVIDGIALAIRTTTENPDKYITILKGIQEAISELSGPRPTQ